jgi:hypothetical protein
MWIIDSGVTDHICNSLSFFSKYASIDPIHIKLPNGDFSIATYSGRVALSNALVLEDVLFIPNFHFNILVVQRTASYLDVTFTLDKSTCVIQEKRTQRTIRRARAHKRLYFLEDLTTLDNIANSCFVCPGNNSVASDVNDSDTWHARLGHPTNKVLQTITNKFPNVKSVFDFSCDTFHLGKQSRLPFPNNNHKTKSVFSLLHIDIWGPLHIDCIYSHKYFLTIVDDHSHHTWVHLMKAKSETRGLLRNFIAYVQTQFNTFVKAIWSDNGLEFNMYDFYAEHGILHQISCVETPQQNSVVERKHRHILNVARCILFNSNIPRSYWFYAISHAIQLINHLLSPSLGNLSPY